MHSQPFHLEFEFETFHKAGAPAGRERRIGGFVSTDHMDQEQEILLQDGLDFSPFLKSGWFNDNHAKNTGSAVGYPEVAELRHLPDGHKGWYVEGYLLQGHPPADEIWNLATALERSGGRRRLGFSVEGSVVERDLAERKVRKAVVREVAVTRCPINDETQLNVLAKSLAAGHAVANPGTAPGEGFPLRVESLESAVTKDEEDEKKRKKRLTKSEAIELLSRNPRLSKESAARIVEYALRRSAA